MNVSYKWIMPKSVNNKKAESLANHLNIPESIARLLVERGISNVKRGRAFLNPSLRQLDDPFKIHDMRKGIQRIKSAIKDQEKITIYGDYDTDGITSVSIMYSLLRHFKANVHYFIPNRAKDGYGPNLAEYKRIIANGTKLLITTDNGISGLKEIGYAREQGMDVIITDHHDFPKQLPNANAIIMSKFPGHQYHHGQEDFCGAGIAFKIAQAMLGRVPKEYLDLAALGTVADSVSLTNENRVIVAKGLKKIQHDTRKGIRALAGMTNIKLDTLTSTGLSFSLIPRLNAIGRMDDANMAVDLLTTHSSNKALEIAQTIEGFNNERKKIVAKEAHEAIQQASTSRNRKRQTLVVWHKNWFPGVVGIIASRLIDKFHKPTLVCGHLKSDPDNVYRGSGRSISGFNLFTAMQPMQAGKHKVMASFGGHPGACGFTINKNNLIRLSKGLEESGKRAHLDKIQPKIKPDLILKPHDINNHTLNALKVMAPFGEGNPAPLIALKIPQIFNLRQMGKTGDHMSFTLGEDYHSVKCVAFGKGNLVPKLENDPFDIEVAGTMNINHWKGLSILQFMVKHLRKKIPAPSKHELGVLYKKLYSAQVMKYHDYIHDLIMPVSRYLEYSPDSIRAALKIFSELHLIRVDKRQGEIHVVIHPRKTVLKESKTYRKLSD